LRATTQERDKGKRLRPERGAKPPSESERGWESRVCCRHLVGDAKLTLPGVGVVSNTIVRDNFLLLGPPMPWHLEALRSRSRLSLKQLIAVTRSSPEYTREDGLERFDAEAWAFVHMLMFGDQGKHQSAINRFSNLISSGTNIDVAFTEAIGHVEDLESGFRLTSTAAFTATGAPIWTRACRRSEFNRAPCHRLTLRLAAPPFTWPWDDKRRRELR